MAVAKSVYVVGVNRAGTEDGQRHFGTSIVVDPTGQEVDAIGADPGTLTAPVDPDFVSDVRHKTKHLNDMRSELLPQLDRL